MTAFPPDSPPPPPPPVASTHDGGLRDERDKQRKTDAGQLKVLMVLHYVFAGLSTLGLGFLYLHHRLMDLMMNTPEMWEQSDQGPPPEEFFALFQYFYLFMGVMIVVFAAANALSARFIQTRRHRIYSLIVAGLNCVLFPFGTALGVFSFIVLLRDSVEENYRLSSAEN